MIGRLTLTLTRRHHRQIAFRFDLSRTNLREVFRTDGDSRRFKRFSSDSCYRLRPISSLL